MSKTEFLSKDPSIFSKFYTTLAYSFCPNSLPVPANSCDK